MKSKRFFRLHLQHTMSLSVTHIYVRINAVFYDLTKSLSCVLAVVLGLVITTQDQEVRLDTSESDALLDNAHMYQFLISKRQVTEELELAGEQRAKILKRKNQIQEKLKKFRDENRERRNESSAEERKLRTEELRKQMATDLELIRNELLPHQNDRLRQILFQYNLGKQAKENATRILLSKKIVAELQISKKQQDVVQQFYEDRDKQLRDEFEKYEKKFRSIQEKSHNKILSKLSPKQQAEVREHIGPPSSVVLSPARFGLGLEGE